MAEAMLVPYCNAMGMELHASKLPEADRQRPAGNLLHTSCKQDQAICVIHQYLLIPRAYKLHRRAAACPALLHQNYTGRALFSGTFLICCQL